MFRITPPPFAHIEGIIILETRKAPVRLTSRVRCHSSSPRSVIFARLVTVAALFTSISIGAWCCNIGANSVCRLASDEISATQIDIFFDTSEARSLSLSCEVSTTITFDPAR